MAFTLTTHTVDRKTGKRTSNPYFAMKEGDVKIYLQGGKFYNPAGIEILPKDLPAFVKEHVRHMAPERKVAYGLLKPKRKRTPKIDVSEYDEVVIEE